MITAELITAAEVADTFSIVAQTEYIRLFVPLGDPSVVVYASNGLVHDTVCCQ